MSNLREVLERFQNGEQRYEQDKHFTDVITVLQSGVGVYAVLDRVLKERAVLLHLHNETLETLRASIAENQRLIDEVESYKDALNLRK